MQPWSVEEPGAVEDWGMWLGHDSADEIRQSFVEMWSDSGYGIRLKGIGPYSNTYPMHLRDQPMTSFTEK